MTAVPSPSPRLDTALPVPLQLTRDDGTVAWWGVQWPDHTVTLKAANPPGTLEHHQSLTGAAASHEGLALVQLDEWSEVDLTDVVPGPFQLRRHNDVTGISGTGIVLRGVEWPDRTVAARWCTKVASLELMASVTVCLNLHGHRGGGLIERAWTEA